MSLAKNYRDILIREYNFRKEMNPQYSLRAFAKKINISPSKISEILSGKCGLSRSRAEDIGKRLNFSQLEQELFITLVDSEHARSKTQRESARKHLRNLIEQESVKLSFKKFEIVAQWYHFALINLLKVDPVVNVNHISERLGIDANTTRKGIRNLIKVGLIELNDNNEAIQGKELLQTDNDIASKAIRHHHQQMLQKALNSLETDDVEEREFQTLMFPSDPEFIKQMKGTIRKFIKEFYTEYTKEKPTEVFSLGIQLFSVSKDVSNV